MAVISIIVPVYNTGRTIGFCLDSLLGQTLKDIEIICVDDGSTDTSTEKLFQYQKKDVRVKILRQENSGVGAARNTGLLAAQGTFIMFCDSDDMYAPDMCEKMYNAIVKEKADLVKCCFKTVFPNRVFDEGDLAAKVENPGLMTDSNTWADQLGRAVWDKIFRHDIIEKYHILFPPVRCSEDVIFYMQYAAVSNSAFLLYDSLYTYFIYKGSLADEESKTGKYKNDVVTAYRYFIDFLHYNNLFNQNFPLLDFFTDELRFLAGNISVNDSFVTKVNDDILCFYDAENLILYPALHAIKSGDKKKLKEAFDSLVVENLLGFRAPPGAMFVNTDKKNSKSSSNFYEIL